MTKKEFLKEIEETANKNGAEVTAKQTEKVYDAVLENIRMKTIKDGEVKLSDLGSFSIKKRAARQGRNPKTGETIKIKESMTVGFKPSKSFKDALV